MILDNTLKLEAVLDAGVAANQPEVHVDYVTWNVAGVMVKPAPFRTALNSSTDVTILAAPLTQGFILEPIFISIYNKDTAAVTVTVKTDDGSTERIIHKTLLDTTRTLFWERGVGWYRSQ